MKCSVRACSNDGVQVFDAGSKGTGPLEFLVCEFHGIALVDGASWTEDGDEILVAVNRLMDWEVNETLGLPRISLTLGDPFEDKVVEFVADPADLRRLCGVLSKYYSESDDA